MLLWDFLMRALRLAASAAVLILVLAGVIYLVAAVLRAGLGP